MAASSKVTTVRGIGFDRDVLVQAGIQHADGLAAATGVDEANVVVARLARQIFRVPRVVARVYEPRNAEIYRRLGIVTVSPLAWGVDRMAEALEGTEAAPVFSLGSGEVNFVIVDVTPLLVGRPVRALTVPQELHVTAIVRNGHALLPASDTVLQTGDRLCLAVTARASTRLSSMMGGI
jgi:trk system potassium uptake protein TrkA